MDFFSSLLFLVLLYDFTTRTVSQFLFPIFIQLIHIVTLKISRCYRIIIHPTLLSLNLVILLMAIFILFFFVLLLLLFTFLSVQTLLMELVTRQGYTIFFFFIHT